MNFCLERDIKGTFQSFINLLLFHIKRNVIKLQQEFSIHNDVVMFDILSVQTFSLNQTLERKEKQ